MKLMVNSYLGIAVQAMAETLHFAETNGLEKAVALEVLSTSAVWSPMLAGKQTMVTSGQYDAQFALKHLTKDLGLTLRQATEHDTFVPAIERVHETFRSAVDSGYGDLDMSALVAFFEDRAK